LIEVKYGEVYDTSQRVNESVADEPALEMLKVLVKIITLISVKWGGVGTKFLTKPRE